VCGPTIQRRLLELCRPPRAQRARATGHVKSPEFAIRIKNRNPIFLYLYPIDRRIYCK
jgi:hypothetical protein